MGILTPRITSKTLPPPRPAVQALVSFLAASLRLLSVLCFLHFGLPGANQSQQHNNPARDISPAIKPLIDQGKNLRNVGRLSEAAAIFSRAIRTAQELNDTADVARGLILLSSVQTSAFQYRTALETLDRARTLAGTLHNLRMSGAVSGNKATIYSALGDLPAAAAESERAVSFLRQISAPDEIEKALLANGLLVHSIISFKLGNNSEAYRESEAAIQVARSIPDKKLEAYIWDQRGFAFLNEKRLIDANNALQKAIALSKEVKDQDDLVYANELLAELELQKDKPDCGLALSLIDQAFAAKNPAFLASPQYYPIHIRARILLRSGNKSAALAEFRRAVAAANQWRAGALPGDITNSRTVAELQELYSDYSQLAADVAFQTHDNSLAANALEVLAENRAASLREQLRQAYGRNLKLPDEYLFKLSQLQSAQANVTLGHNAPEDQAQLSRIRLDISNLENQIGLKLGKISVADERIPRRNSLRDIQHTLGKDQVLLSITLGEPRSYLWTVTSEKVSLVGLPGEGEITSKANSFASAVREGRSITASSTSLSHALFAGLPSDVWQRSEWMIVGDGSLLDGVPFSALTNPLTGNRLIQGRSIRFLPSELLLLDQQDSARIHKSRVVDFVGIGDPIYNLADARLPRVQFADAKSVTSSVSLARLVGSEREIRSAAEESHTQPILLTGTLATRDELAKSLATDPKVIHFAVHVVSPPSEPQQAALALSLRNGIPELLTPEVVSSFHTPGSLVVLSGCSSGQGKVLPGVGLVGLSRAWLLAGAAAVVVSDWPTPDDSGKFFTAFYGHFNSIHSGNTAQRAALALSRTQEDMQSGKGYQTSPSFWGAFAVVSKE